VRIYADGWLFEILVEQMRNVMYFGLWAIDYFVRYYQRRDAASRQTARRPLAPAPVYYHSPQSTRYRRDAFRRSRLD
jgi:hypothetical protein